MIKQALVMALVGILGSVQASADTQPELTDTLTADCRLLVGEFKRELMGEFMPAMKDGGPVNAIGVCQTKAPAVAQRFSKLDGWAMRRTALRTRNSANAADEFERAALKALAADSVSEVSQWVTDTDGHTQFRYLSAITMAKPCMACHGDPAAIDDSLKSVIARLYPNDKATGFEPGQLRGAFSITVDWPGGKAVADSLWRLAGAESE